MALRENSDGSHTLTFDAGGSTTDVVADYVALALPFTLLRDVDISRAGFTAEKVRVIDTLGMGSNAKIHLEVAEKTWARHGFNGVAYTSHDSFDVCWDDSVPLGPHGAPALLLAFPGANAGRNTLTGDAHGPSPVKDVNWFLDSIDPIFPGTRAAFTGAAYEDHWVRDPWVKGAYSYYRVGQYATFGQIAAAAAGTRPFRGRAHLDQQPGLPRRRRRDRGASGEGDLRAAVTLSSRVASRTPARCRARYVLAFSREPHTRIEHQQLRPFLEWS